MARVPKLPQDSGRAERPSGVPPPRAPWTPAEIVHYGSIRHLVRGISGFKADTMGMPGKRP